MVWCQLSGGNCPWDVRDKHGSTILYEGQRCRTSNGSDPDNSHSERARCACAVECLRGRASAPGTVLRTTLSGKAFSWKALLTWFILNRERSQIDSRVQTRARPRREKRIVIFQLFFKLKWMFLWLFLLARGTNKYNMLKWNIQISEHENKNLALTLSALYEDSQVGWMNSSW